MARMRKTLVALFVLAAMLLAGLGFDAPRASAQDYDVAVTCSAYGRALGLGGQPAADAAAELQAIGAPNPPGIESALQIVIESEADVAPSGSRPSNEAVQGSRDALSSYFGGICSSLDICPWVRQAVATNDGSSAEAARLVRGIEAPAPPGIDAALALISGAVDFSPFHTSVAEAQAQISSYFPCDLVITADPGNTGGGDTAGGEGAGQGTSDGEGTGAGDAGGGDTIAFTGAETAPLAIAGATLIAAGGLLLITRRRLRH